MWTKADPFILDTLIKNLISNNAINLSLFKAFQIVVDLCRGLHMIFLNRLTHRLIVCLN
jgi:hypothetical protein